MGPRRERGVAWRTGLLVVLLAGLLGWFWALRSQRPTETDLGRFRAPAWVMDAERIVYESRSDSIVVARRGERFEVVHPISDHADPTRVLQSLRAAVQLSPTRALPADDLADFGLAPPRHRFGIWTPAGQTWSIAIGDTVPVGGRVYAHIENAAEPGTVLLLREFSARQDFSPTADQLRDRVALPLGSPVVDSIQVDAGSYHLRALRGSRDVWIAREPEGLELDPLPIHRALRVLRTPTIREFAPPGADPADYGLARPRATWVAFEGAVAETVWIGSATPEGDGVWVRPAGRDAIGNLPTDTYREFVDGWPRLASRRLSYRRADAIGRIEFPGTEAAYVRSDSGWFRLPEAHPVRNVPALVRDLENLLAMQWEAYPIHSESPDPSAESVQVRLVPDSVSAADPSPLEPVTELITLAGYAEPGLGLARTNRRELWGRVPDAALRVWIYRLAHPDL